MRIVLLILILFQPLVCRAELLSLHYHRDLKSLGIKNIPLPIDDLKEQVKSGFTSSLIISILKSESSELIGEPLRLIVFYDLWDEIYRLKRVSKSGVTSQNLKSQKLLLDELQSPKIAVDESSLPPSIKIRVVLNPISKEKVQKIRKWLAQNSVNVPASASSSQQGQGGLNSSKTPNHPENSLAGARFGGLLQEVFEYELDGIQSGAWTYLSEPIKVESRSP